MATTEATLEKIVPPSPTEGITTGFRGSAPEITITVSVRPWSIELVPPEAVYSDPYRLSEWLQQVEASASVLLDGKGLDKKTVLVFKALIGVLAELEAQA